MLLFGPIGADAGHPILLTGNISRWLYCQKMTTKFFGLVLEKISHIQRFKALFRGLLGVREGVQRFGHALYQFWYTLFVGTAET